MSFLEELKSHLTSIIPSDIELFDITFAKEQGGRVLRITLDGGDLSLDRITTISRHTSKYLDANEDKIPYDKYTLEVTSAGLDRPLRGVQDYKRSIGYVCKIETKSKAEDGRKKYNGVIKSAEDDILILYSETESKTFEVSISDIKKAKLEYLVVE